MSIPFKKILFTCWLVSHASLLSAELVIEITKGVKTNIPIAVAPFASTNKIAVDLAAVINADLSRSGFFTTLAKTDMPTQSMGTKIKYQYWRALGQEYVVIGKISEESGRYRLWFQMFDIYRGGLLLGHQWLVEKSKLRATAHRISDLIYAKLTGKKGFFSTRMAYIASVPLANNKKRYELLVADVDGSNPKDIVRSRQPLMSPAWSPDGKKIAYVAFENNRSVIFIQTIASGKRVKVSSHKGINGAPAFSPDGKRLALTLSKDGNPDIYVLNLTDNSLLKITKSYSIDTEATWSADGKFIVYTSNRGGRPQLYKIPSRGGIPVRLTFEGDYNSRGRFSADGKNLTMIQANHEDYRVAVMDMKTRTVRVLTTGRYDESPSFSPDGDMILFTAKNSSKKNTLMIVSADGKRQANIVFSGVNVHTPVWSP